MDGALGVPTVKPTRASVDVLGLAPPVVDQARPRGCPLGCAKPLPMPGDTYDPRRSEGYADDVPATVAGKKKAMGLAQPTKPAREGPKRHAAAL